MAASCREIDEASIRNSSSEAGSGMIGPYPRLKMRRARKAATWQSDLIRVMGTWTAMKQMAIVDLSL